MDSKSMGRILRAYRAKKGWTIQRCAEEIGISTNYLADIERGYKVPKLNTFVTILNCLSASADHVLQDSIAVGYNPKSNEILHSIAALGEDDRKLAVDMISAIVKTIKERRGL